MRAYIQFILPFLVIVTSIDFVKAQSYQERAHEVQIGGIKLYYTIRGHGPVMIVGHSNSGKKEYELTLKPLERYFTMVYYDPRGTGRSERPKTLEEYNQDNIVEEIENLRAKLKIDKIWIFGHSDQSAIALEYALRFPSHTSGLILSGTGIVGTQQEMVERRRKSENERAKNSPWFAQVIKDWDYMIEHQTQTDKEGRDISEVPIKWWCYNEKSSQEVIQVVKEISKAGRRKPVNGEFYAETKRERQKYLDYQKRFPEIKADVLIVNGKYDTNNPPEYAEELHQVLPNSTLVLIDKAGHFPWVENPADTFEGIEKWLKRQKVINHSF